MTDLDAEEQEILKSVQNNEWQSMLNSAQEIQRYQRYARSQLEQISLEMEEISDAEKL